MIELEELSGKHTHREIVKEVHYESLKFDQVEEMMKGYLENHPVKINIEKIGDGYYKFGTKRIYVKVEREMLMVRIGPKDYITLNMFIIENEGIELQK